jgi:hypothetical protein
MPGEFGASSGLIWVVKHSDSGLLGIPKRSTNFWLSV